jgi:hypothetical protein
MAPEIRFAGDAFAVTFDRFDAADTYALFLRVKKLPEYRVDYDPAAESYTVSAPRRFAAMLGVPVPDRTTEELALHASLLDDQRWIVAAALESKRFACWSDCGQGKTFMGLEFARHVIHRASAGGRVLIVTLNEIVPQWIEESQKFYGDALPVARLESRAEMREWCQHGTVSGAPAAAIAVTNYEKFNHKDPADQVVNECRHLAGVILDESSRLKTGGGKQKWAIIKSCRGIEYKLSLTATPAPNELMEFASQASFLEKMRAETLRDAAEQIIWTYFTRDPKTHRWTIKQHARAAFFEWMSSWSIYVRDPRRYGWRMNVEPPPEPEYFTHAIPMTDAQRALVWEINSDPKNVPEKSAGSMFVGELNAIAVNRLSQAAKGFQYSRVAGRRRVTAVESAKPAKVAELVTEEAAGRGLQVLVWTEFDRETEIVRGLLAKSLRGRKVKVETLTGQTCDADRVKIPQPVPVGKGPRPDHPRQDARVRDELPALQVDGVQRVDVLLRELLSGGAVPDEAVDLTVTSIPFEELFTYSGKLEDVGNNGSTVDIRGGAVRAEHAVRDRAAAPRDRAGHQRLHPHPATPGLQEPARLQRPPRLPRGDDRRLHRQPLRRRIRSASSASS